MSPDSKRMHLFTMKGKQGRTNGGEKNRARDRQRQREKTGDAENTAEKQFIRMRQIQRGRN